MNTHCEPCTPTAVKMNYPHCEATGRETNMAKMEKVIFLGRSQLDKTHGMADPWNWNPATRGSPLMQTLRIDRDECQSSDDCSKGRRSTKLNCFIQKCKHGHRIKDEKTKHSVDIAILEEPLRATATPSLQGCVGKGTWGEHTWALPRSAGQVQPGDTRSSSFFHGAV